LEDRLSLSVVDLGPVNHCKIVTMGLSETTVIVITMLSSFRFRKSTASVKHPRPIRGGKEVGAHTFPFTIQRARVLFRPSHDPLHSRIFQIGTKKGGESERQTPSSTVTQACVRLRVHPGGLWVERRERRAPLARARILHRDQLECTRHPEVDNSPCVLT